MRKNLNSNKGIVITVFATSVIFLNILFYVISIIGGHSFWDKYFIKYFFDDFTNPMKKTFENAYFEPYYSNYPAMANLFFMLIKPAGLDETGDYSQCSSFVEYKLLYFILAIASTIFLCELIRDVLVKFERKSVTLFITAILTSAPLIFLIARGNILLFIFPFILYYLAYYDSENTKKRYLAFICLALAVSIKIYPVFLGLLSLKRRKVKDLIVLVSCGAVFFFVPFLFFGLKSIPAFLENLFVVRNGEGYYAYTRGISINAIVSIFYAQLTGSVLPINDNVVSILFLAIMITMVFLSKKNWQRMFFVTFLAIGFFKSSYIYNIIFLVFPLMYLFLDKTAMNLRKFLIMVCCVITLIPIVVLPSCDKVINVLGAKISDVYNGGLMIIQFSIFVLWIVVIIDALVDLLSRDKQRT